MGWSVGCLECRGGGAKVCAWQQSMDTWSPQMYITDSLSVKPHCMPYGESLAGNHHLHATAQHKASTVGNQPHHVISQHTVLIPPT